MIDVPVSAVTTPAAPTVPPNTPAVEAARHLRRADVRAVVVRDAGTVVGIVTESDIVAVVAEGGTNPPVESFMSAPVVTVESATPVGLAADRMRDAGVTCLPVVDSEGSKTPRADSEERRSSGNRPRAGDGEGAGNDGRYRGLVTRADIAPYLSRHRLEIDWQGDPLSLDGAGAPDAATE